MGYLSIGNLYRDQAILLFKEAWALEKIHGSSTHISFNNGTLGFFAGGCSHESFVKIFNQEDLLERFKLLGRDKVIVYGEGYGGKMQRMSGTYGTSLAFAAFDVMIGDSWLSVPDAEQVVLSLGLEFVPYEKVSTDLAELDRVRDKPSEIAVRRGCGADKLREGVVLRPLIELTKNNGDRIIVKHKGEAFNERSTPQQVTDPKKLAVLKEAEAIAQEWVTENRLSNVLSHQPPDISIEATGKICQLMVDDIAREAAGEIVFSDDAARAVKRMTAKMFKERLNERMRQNIKEA